jgi:hypothetical protein
LFRLSFSAEIDRVGSLLRKNSVEPEEKGEESILTAPAGPENKSYMFWSDQPITGSEQQCTGIDFRGDPILQSSL